MFAITMMSLVVLLVSTWYWVQYHRPPPFGAHEIVPGLWLGNFEDSLQAAELRQRNITHILSVATGLYPHHRHRQEDSEEEESEEEKKWRGFEHMVVRVMDVPGQDLLSYLPIAHAFIQEGHKAGAAVLVHCMAGISRSSTCLISYIMRDQGLSLEEALKLAQAKRSIVNPNSGFLQQLKNFEQLLQNEKDKPVGEAIAVDEEEEEGRSQPWMKAEIVRWHPRERQLEVVQSYGGKWTDRTRAWLTHVGTQVWIYHFRRFIKVFGSLVGLQ